MTGEKYGIMIFGQIYYYVYGAFGDVIALADTNGKIVAKYTYGAWGEIESITDGEGNDVSNDPTHVANINPIRYRGYYYDEETGFYYLNSRYYDPVVHRFINADGQISGISGNLLGNNLFAYCFNNPINMSDPDGQWPKWIKNSVKWLAKNILKPAGKTLKKTFSKVDATYSRGINISGTPSAFTFNLQLGISVDTKGNIAIQGTASGGATCGSPGASITTYRSITNAPNIDRLNGSGYQIGSSIGIPVYGIPFAVGGDLNIIPYSAQNKTYYGTTTGLGVGTPGGEVHVEWGETATWDATRFNIFDFAEDIYSKVMEW